MLVYNSTRQATKGCLENDFSSLRTVSSSNTRIFSIKIKTQKWLKACKVINFMHEIPKFLDKLVLGGKNCGWRIYFR
jgi:hypothetical protein